MIHKRQALSKIQNTIDVLMEFNKKSEGTQTDISSVD
jgi:hypothetical protein